MKTFTRLIVLFLWAGNVSLVSASVDPDTASSNSTSKSVPLNSTNQKSDLPIGLTGRKDVQSPNESKYKRWTKLKYSGYVRSYNQFRHMPVGYGGQENLITVNGLDIIDGGTVYTGYQEPLFLLRLEGNPTSKTSFKVEYLFDHQMFGNFNEDTYNLGLGPSATANRRASVYRIFEFTGKANTKIGSFKLTAGGGVIWQRLSPFTYWNYEYRDHMFERYPWEPEGNPWSRYNQFYSDQSISRDARWGNTGTQGFVLEGTGLPLGLNFTAIYGKTDNSGSFQTFLTRTPKNVIAGKLEKTLGRHSIGVNYFNQFGFTDGNAHNLYYDVDSLGRGLNDESTPEYDEYLLTTMYRIRQQIVTVDTRLNFGDVRIYAEAGVGRYQDSLIERFSGHNDSLNAFLENQVGLEQSGNYFVKGLNYGWGHAVNLQLEFGEALTRVPFGLQFFSVTPNVVNINSAVLNTANPNALGTLENVGTVSDNTTFQGGTTELYNSQMANNRWGIRLRHEDSYGKLKVIAAIDAQQEHENIFNSVTFMHQANAFTRSRIGGYFRRGIGPYQRILNIFRRSFERIDITDSVTNYKKSYNSALLSLKYKFLLLNKELIVTSFTNYNSVQDNFRPVPAVSNDAFLRTFYQEFLAFYAIHPRLTLVGLASMERNVGNDRTVLANDAGDIITDADGEAVYDPDGDPINQYGYGYGVGVDYDLSNRAGLFIRQRWFHFKDVNQIQDRFGGFETTVELKIFF